MPLAPSGARGYADWQRIGNWDSAVLWNLPATGGPPSVIGPIVNVSRYAYLALKLTPSVGQCQVAVNWFADSLGAVTTATRIFNVTNAIQNFAFVRIPNLGPFVQVSFNPLSGGAFTITAILFATNRVYALDFIPQNPVLIDQQNIAIGAGITATVYPFDYYAGPINLNVSVGQQPNTLAMQWLNNIGNWDTMLQFDGSTTVDQILSWVAPPGAWRMQVTNGAGAAGNFWLRVTQSMTGAGV